MSASSLSWTSAPVDAPLRGPLRVPGDKSVSHRAIMLSALAEGTTRIRGFLEGEDTRATARAFVRMGVRIEAPSYLINHGLADCIRRIILPLHFPQNSKAQIATYPFSLR